MLVVTSTLSAVKRLLLVNPLGTLDAWSVSVSLSTSKPLITTSPSKATGEPFTNFIS